MNPIKLIFKGVFVILLILVGSCRSKHTVSNHLSYTSFATSLVTSSPSGIITVRAWGNAPDKQGALEAAKKNAVADVIFKGIKGASGYNANPIVTEVNARERYAEYFDRFFADGGEYAKFVIESSSTDGSRTKAKSAGRENYGVTLDIDRPSLTRQLHDDGIINRH